MAHQLEHFSPDAAVPDSITKLIKRFGEQQDTYMSGSYNETQVRRDFIDPFFKALGWDIDNENDYAEAYRDVIHEDMVLVGNAKKAPDYSFRVGGTRKFFVEAKRPSVSISLDPKPAFQLRRYGWSAKLPLSIVTDFEEFAVYDCTHMPVENQPSHTARLHYYKYTEYAEKWQEISGLFSKQAVMKGSFDRFANEKKRGSTTVDEAFLSEIEKWRQSLASNILLNNDISQRELNLAVQLTIDRIIFLRICEDRGIETYERLLKLSKGKNLYHNLTNRFKDADDRYNSGLFHFNLKEKHATPADTLTLKLKIDDAPLRTIIESLYPPNPYEFSVIPADILGQVYERFLGKVIEIDGKKALIEEKPEVKKAGGVFYTPSYIVEHIVKQTVEKLLAGKTPKQVEKLKIVDPACGSGSFLIVAYQHLLDWHLNYYTTNGGGSKFKKELHLTETGMQRLTTQVRKSILLNNIFGVDIDAQAVEVSKLSLLLKVLEGESGEAIGKNLSLFHERALPDLGDNIKCGNSLVDNSFYAQENLPELLEDTQYRINAFDWADEFPVVKANGFDVVIGNPPYGATLYPLEKAFLQKAYKHQSYQLDSYLLFIELAITKILKKGGLWGMIIPNAWITNLRQDKLRHLVTSQTTIKQIVHFNYPVFKSAIVDTEIVIFANGFQKATMPSVFVVPKETALDLETEARFIQGNQDDWLKHATQPVNVFLDARERALKEKVFNHPLRISHLFTVNVGIKPYQTGKGNPAQTKEDVKGRIFDATTKRSAAYRQYLRGKDIGRFNVAPLEIRWLKYGVWLAEPRPAAKFDAPEKLLVRQTGDEIIAALDTDKFLCLNNLHVLVPNEKCLNIKGVLGIMNSKIMTWCLRAMNPEAGEALAEVKKEFVEMLPIPELGNLSAITKIAEILISLKKSPPSTHIDRQIKMRMKQIDDLAYQAFGLNAEEIAIVEAALN